MLLLIQHFEGGRRRGGGSVKWLVPDREDLSHSFLVPKGIRAQHTEYPAALTLLCPYFSLHLPCCTLTEYFIFTYPAVRFFFRT